MRVETVESARSAWPRPSSVRPAERPVRALWAAAPALLGYLAVRAAGVLLAVHVGRDEQTGGLRRLATLWDAWWYQSIADHGYSGTGPVAGPHGAYQPYAFFPGYPALIRALPVSAEWAALAVSWAAAVAAAWGIFAIADHVYGRRVGVLTVLLWGVLPVAVIENAAYSEALFTAFAAWAVYAALTRRWVLAGLLSSAAGLTRPTGIALAAAIGAAALWELLRGRGGWRALGAIALAPLGFVGYLAWVGHRMGRWDGYFRVQDAWESHFDLGRATWKSLKQLFAGGGQVWFTDVVVAATLITAVLMLGVSLVQRQPLVVLLYSAAMLALALGDAAYFNSRARFLLPAFGLLLPVATALARTRNRLVLPLAFGMAALVSAAYGGYLLYGYPDAP
ncbi:glycosyltransferase family 39 protein [Kitasatospora sp. NPDC049285]|uniref:glycosyltransferase family 39 protein n=1 Tax=Kitasatospora sp. NPDC049285 TaxID=3157096 RepID=UPI003420B9C8